MTILTRSSCSRPTPARKRKWRSCGALDRAPAWSRLRSELELHSPARRSIFVITVHDSQSHEARLLVKGDGRRIVEPHSEPNLLCTLLPDPANCRFHQACRESL